MKVFVIGFMGSGKTHWGRIWAKENQLDFYDLDELIEKEERRSITTIFEENGEDHFRAKETAVLKNFAEEEHYLLACGGGTPCFNDNMQWMNDNGTTIYLSASPQYLFEKIIGEKDKRPLIKNLNPGELLSFIEQKLKEREVIYKQARIILSVEKLHAASLEGIINY